VKFSAYISNSYWHLMILSDDRMLKNWCNAKRLHFKNHIHCRSYYGWGAWEMHFNSHYSSIQSTGEPFLENFHAAQSGCDAPIFVPNYIQSFKRFATSCKVASTTNYQPSSIYSMPCEFLLSPDCEKSDQNSRGYSISINAANWF